MIYLIFTLSLWNLSANRPVFWFACRLKHLPSLKKFRFSSFLLCFSLHFSDDHRFSWHWIWSVAKGTHLDIFTLLSRITARVLLPIEVNSFVVYDFSDVRCDKGRKRPKSSELHLQNIGYLIAGICELSLSESCKLSKMYNDVSFLTIALRYWWSGHRGRNTLLGVKGWWRLFKIFGEFNRKTLLHPSCNVWINKWQFEQ